MGVTSGLHIGFNRLSIRLLPPPANFCSVTNNPHKVERYIALEVAAGRLLAVHTTADRANTQVASARQIQVDSL